MIEREVNCMSNVSANSASDAVRVVAEWAPRRGEKARMSRLLGIPPTSVSRAIRRAREGKQTRETRLMAEYILAGGRASSDRLRKTAAEVARELAKLDLPVSLTAAVKLVKAVDSLGFLASDDDVREAVLSAAAARVTNMFTGETYVVFAVDGGRHESVYKPDN